MESISTPNDVIEQLLYQQSGYWLAAGGATLLIYDWLLCLDREVQYLWKARWSFGKVWFIIHRYAMMALVVGLVYGAVKSSTKPSSPEWCRMWDGLSNVGSIVIILAIEGTFALRVCALYHNSPSIIALLSATYVSCSGAMLIFLAKLHQTLHYFSNTLTNYHVCVRTCDNCIRWCICLYIPLMLLDVVILILTLRQSFDAVYLKGSQRNIAPIMVTLFRDGVLYFVVAFAAALVNILFNVFGPWAAKPWMVNYTRPLLSSMATRLLLNLHDQVSRTVHYPTDPQATAFEGGENAFSTVEFAHPTIERDVESAFLRVSGGRSSIDDRTRSGDRDNGANAFEMKALGEAGREESTPRLEWAESERTLTASGRRQHGVAMVDPG